MRLLGRTAENVAVDFRNRLDLAVAFWGRVPHGHMRVQRTFKGTWQLRIVGYSLLRSVMLPEDARKPSYESPLRAPRQCCWQRDTAASTHRNAGRPPNDDLTHQKRKAGTKRSRFLFSPTESLEDAVCCPAEGDLD